MIWRYRESTCSFSVYAQRCFLLHQDEHLATADAVQRAFISVSTFQLFFKAHIVDIVNGVQVPMLLDMLLPWEISFSPRKIIFKTTGTCTLFTMSSMWALKNNWKLETEMKKRCNSASAVARKTFVLMERKTTVGVNATASFLKEQVLIINNSYRLLSYIYFERSKKFKILLLLCSLGKINY